MPYQPQHRLRSKLKGSGMSLDTASTLLLGIYTEKSIIDTSPVVQHHESEYFLNYRVNMHIKTQNSNMEQFRTAQLDEATTISVVRRKRDTIPMFYMLSSSWMMSSISRVEHPQL
jgi:hypothetical protein